MCPSFTTEKHLLGMLNTSHVHKFKRSFNGTGSCYCCSEQIQNRNIQVSTVTVVQEEHRILSYFFNYYVISCIQVFTLIEP